MSKDELNAVIMQADALKRQEKEKKLQDEQALAQLENDLVAEMFADAKPLSNAIVMFKQKWIDKLRPLVDEKIKHNKAKADQESYTFKTEDAEQKVKMRNNKRCCYDDGIQAGIGFTKQWMADQVDGEKKQTPDLHH